MYLGQVLKWRVHSKNGQG